MAETLQPLPNRGKAGLWTRKDEIVNQFKTSDENSPSTIKKKDIGRYQEKDKIKWKSCV